MAPPEHQDDLAGHAGPEHHVEEAPEDLLGQEQPDVLLLCNYLFVYVSVCMFFV